jgi:hypothetical protein
MAEPTSRIDPASSYRESEARTPLGGMKEKTRPKSKSRAGQAELPEPDELDDPEKHELDTLA